MNLTKLFIGILLLFILSETKSQPIKENYSIEQFKNPPQKVHVHTWWHWIDGRITRDGITKDLESMKQQGISQATILNVSASAGNGLGVSRIAFNSEEWYAMFHWALQEAKRLGIFLGVHNCDGWSESGGPWITPELSMKKFVFTKAVIREEQTHIVLFQPLCDTKFYRDVAVIAYPDENAAPISDENLAITLNDTIDARSLADGNPESCMEVRKNDHLLFDYHEPKLKTRLILLHNFKGAFYFPGPKTIEYEVKASDDGKNFRKIADVATNKFYGNYVANIPPTSARFFRVEVSKINNLRPWHHAALAELQLLNNNEQPAYNPTIANPLEKTASARIIDPGKLYSATDDSFPQGVIHSNDIINLTGKMLPDGTLDWDKPAGKWVVIRFGYTTTGAENGPATPEGRGLECDKLDTLAVNVHFQNFPQKLIDHASGFTGNTFKFLMIDSWERGYQTWTARFPEEFEKRRGYSLTKWIPVLCGETIENSALSEAFLYDFRKTIADLFEQNYYKHFSNLCHRNGLELHGEVMYGDTGPFPPIDVLRTNGILDMPMFEFWADANNQNLVEYKPGKNLLVNFAAYTSNFYNRPVIGAEAYTGFAHYSESPSDLKLFGDRAYCSGINQMILHSYVHQPAEKKPGLTLGQHGSHFNRNNPWWNYAKGWIDYQSRIQYVLQKGAISADILYFLGDQYPQFFENKTISNLPEGYQSVPCNADVLQKLSVVNGKLSFSKSQNYSVLVLPDWPVMEFETLQQVEKLLNAGAVIYGNKPLQMFSMKGKTEHGDDFRRHTEKIWKGWSAGKDGRNRIGKGTIIWGGSIAGVLKELNLASDFTTQKPDSLNLMYIHKNTANDDVFFVVNQQDTTIVRDCFFKTKEKSTKLWNPLTGEVKLVPGYPVGNQQIRVPATFKPRESLFFIFNNEPAEMPTTGLEPKISIINNLKGKIIFHPVNSVKIDTVEILNLKALTSYEEPSVRFFSGIAEYQLEFDLSKDYLTTENPLYLSLGDFDATAEIILNDKFLGYCWMPDTPLPVGNLLREKNHLIVRLATTCRNRIIGDLNEYKTLKNLWTAGPVTNFLKKDSSLKPSGIIGPLKLIGY